MDAGAQDRGESWVEIKFTTVFVCVQGKYQCVCNSTAATTASFLFC